MKEREEICFILKNIFRCDSISCYEDNDFNMKRTIFVLNKDGESYNVAIDNKMIEEIPFKQVAGYISAKYIDLMLYKTNRSD